MKIVIKRMSGLLITLFLVIVNAILIEVILDYFGIQKHRLFTGITGTFLIILSFGYSMRKRKIITTGKAKAWLYGHEWFTIGGAFILFIHTGTHFKAIVPVATLAFMFIAFFSGLVGRYVYENTKAEIMAKQKGFQDLDMSKEEIEQKLWALTVASDALSKWRVIHMPIVSILGVMVLYHALSALYFSGF